MNKFSCSVQSIPVLLIFFHFFQFIAKSLMLINFFQVLSSSIKHSNFFQVSCNMCLFGMSCVLVIVQFKPKNSSNFITSAKTCVLSFYQSLPWDLYFLHDLLSYNYRIIFTCVGSWKKKKNTNWQTNKQTFSQLALFFLV